MKPIICTARSFRGATEGGEPGIHSPRPVVMDSGLAASDLGLTRDRHYTMRTSATADVRWRSGMTPIVATRNIRDYRRLGGNTFNPFSAPTDQCVCTLPCRVREAEL